MPVDDLVRLAKKYKAERSPDLDIASSVLALGATLRNRDEKPLHDISDAIASFTATVAKPLLSLEFPTCRELPPQIREAYDLAYPTLSLSDLPCRTPDQIQGVVNGWKGKYFEILVRDQLNAGHRIGDIKLPIGATARLAESSNQPAWDLEIINEDGSLNQELQLKATKSLGYVMNALERYPEISILTTDEVLDADISNDANWKEHVQASGFSNEDLIDKINSAVDGLEGISGPMADVIEAVPGLSFVIISLDEGRKVLMRRKSLAAAIESAKERLVATGVAVAIGAGLAWADAGALSIPAVISVKNGIARKFSEARMIKRFESATEQLRRNFATNRSPGT
jgi:hypothetical protein